MNRSEEAVASPALEAADPHRARTNLRLAAASALLGALVVAQSAGLRVADTKIDLILAPGRMLQRSLSMWDPINAFGQVGNQAYGYLFPMGPFFVFGEWLNVPSWLVQRLWMGVVLICALQGAARLARELGVRSDTVLLITGFAYALSPRMISTIGPISIEAWPSAVAPWVLLALVIGSKRGDPRLQALLAALAVGLVGGVNAAASFSVVPLGAIWILTRASGKRRSQLLLWWPVFTLLCCLWWLVPLFILGSFSPPFLDYIETTQVTTLPTTLFDSLRGTSAWIPYLESRWRAGNDLLRTPSTILNSTAVILLGLAGLGSRRNPHRAFLALALLAGMLMVTAGHLGPVHGWFSADLRNLLDGVLAPLRNVHKFDPVIRLPMVLAMGLYLDGFGRAKQDTVHPRKPIAPQGPNYLVVVAAIAVVGASLPIVTGRLMPAQAFTQVPTEWRAVAKWLHQQNPQDRALLLPSSSFANYNWGFTGDEPLQGFAQSPWAVRNAIPLAPVGNIRALDALEQRISRGHGSSAVVDYLRRLGVRFLVVRNDLAPSRDVADPAIVHQALANTPDLTRVRTFGSLVGGEPVLETADARLVINEGWQAAYPAIEIFEVSGAVSAATASSTTTTVMGAPEDLLSLGEMKVLDDQPTVLAVNRDRSTALRGPLVLTDGLRLQQRALGRLHDGESATLTRAEAEGVSGSLRDYRVGDSIRDMTVARYRGIKDLRVSSSLADPSSPNGSNKSRLGYAALDGDPSTVWISQVEAHPSLHVEFSSPQDLDRIEITPGAIPTGSSTIRVRTENGITDDIRMVDDRPRSIELPAGRTTWLSIESATDGEEQLSIADLVVPGVHATRELVLPAVPAAWGSPDVIALDARADSRTGCVRIGASQRCRDEEQRGSEEASGMQRSLTIPTPRKYRVRASVMPRSGAAISTLLQRDQPLNIEASSTAASAASMSSALAAVDGDPGTTWISSDLDAEPSLKTQWLGRKTVDAISVVLDDGAAARRPTRVKLSYRGGSQTVTLDEAGTADIRPVRTDFMTLTVLSSSNTASIGANQQISPVGVGVSELRLHGMPYAPMHLSTDTRALPCGSGPALMVNGRSHRTSVEASATALHEGRSAALRVCGVKSLQLAAGINTVGLGATSAFSPARVVLTSTGWHPPSASPADRTSENQWKVPPQTRLFSIKHNVNRGWTAHRGAQRLTPVVVDGWKQGFALVPGTSESEISTSFSPNRSYRAWLITGALTLALCLGIALVSWRRPIRSRRRGHVPSVGEARHCGTVAAIAWLAGIGFLSSTAGLILFVTACAILLATRRCPFAATVGALSPVVVVGVWNALRPWGDPAGWVGSQTLAQLSLVIPLAFVALRARAPKENSLSRMEGTSTQR